MAFRFVMLRRLLAVGLLCAGAAACRAMSVIAPSFDELVSSADLVVRGVVTDIHCVAADTPQGQAIRTLVTLHVERVLKGSADADVTLSFLGGKLGTRSLRVVGMPTFAVGDRELVFVARNGHVICPLIAAGYGRYHVRHDTATNRDFIARDNNVPLTSTDQIVQPLEASEQNAPRSSPATALTPDVFENRILNAVRNSAAKLQP